MILVLSLTDNKDFCSLFVDCERFIKYSCAVGQIGKAPDAVRDSLPVPPAREKAAAAAALDSESDEEDVSKMQERLEALRS